MASDKEWAEMGEVRRKRKTRNRQRRVRMRNREGFVRNVYLELLAMGASSGST
jgi:hypothetical protein